MTGLRLNLGCGMRHLAGYVNVDKFGEPDLRHDLERFPWPWPDDSVAEIVLNHVLEHLGHDPAVFLGIIRELYRVSRADAAIRIVVPAIGNDFIAMIKDTALVYAIGVQELLMRANNAGRSTVNVMEALLFAALIYWGLTIAFSFVQQRLEQRLARSDR